MYPGGGVPFVNNQEPCAFATYSLLLIYYYLVCVCKIKQYTYNFNDKNACENMYT